MAGEAVLYAISQAKVEGSRVSRAFLTDLPRMDARDEIHSILLGRVIDGWIVIQRTSGPGTFEELDRVARREWRKLIKTRARSQRNRRDRHTPYANVQRRLIQKQIQGVIPRIGTIESVTEPPDRSTISQTQKLLSP